jgi:hypothetical protein
MPEPALREHVLDALRQTPGITVTDLGKGRYQIAKGDDIRVIELDKLVPRNFLGKLERWYKVPRADWYPPASFQPVVKTETKADAS